MRQLDGRACFIVVFVPIIVFVILVALTSCAPATVVKLPEATATNTPLPTGTFVSFAKTPTQQPKAAIERFNFIILGGDFRESRENTGYGDKTDVMIVVSILMSDPVQITLIQLPRNLYVPVENFPDLWAFAVYRQEGFAGIHYWFQEVFDLTVQGIAYTDMDNFVKFVDGMDGVFMGTSATGSAMLSGEEILAYLRDNENNWAHDVYDYEGRAFRVFMAIASAMKRQFTDDPFETAELLWQYRKFVETDLSSFEQFHWVIEMVFNIIQKGYNLNFVQLTEPTIIYGETPTYPGRGYIANADLVEWMRMVLENVVY